MLTLAKLHFILKQHKIKSVCLGRDENCIQTTSHSCRNISPSALKSPADEYENVPTKQLKPTD